MGQLRTLPYPSLKTEVNCKAFYVWFQYFCHTPLFDPNTPCSKPGYPGMLDTYWNEVNSLGALLLKEIWG